MHLHIALAEQSIFEVGENTDCVHFETLLYSPKVNKNQISWAQMSSSPFLGINAASKGRKIGHSEAEDHNHSKATTYV